MFLREESPTTIPWLGGRAACRRVTLVAALREHGTNVRFEELGVCGGAAREDGGVLCPLAAEIIASAKKIRNNFRRKPARNGQNACISIYRSGRRASEKGDQSASGGFRTCL